MSKGEHKTKNVFAYVCAPESAGQGFNFMDISRGNLRSKSDATDVWAFFMELLNHARNGNTLGGGSAGQISINTRYPEWTLSGGQLVTQITVTSSIGYTMSASTNQIDVSGYTGGTQDTLTITAPTSLMGTDVSIYFQTPSSSGGVTLYWFEPSSSSKQRVVVTEMSTGGGQGQSTSVTITGEFYTLQINKRDGYTGDALDGATFQLHSDNDVIGLQQIGAGRYAAGGSQSTFTTSGGSAHIENLPAGNYQVVEVSAPSSAYTPGSAANISLHRDSTVTIDNNPIKLEILKTNGLTGAPMPNITFTLKDGSGDPVNLYRHEDGTYRPGSSSSTFTVDSNGKAMIMYLPAGNYSIFEPQTPGYAALKNTSFALNGNTTVGLVNDPLALLLTKYDSFTETTMAGVAFSLFDSSGNPVPVTQQSDGVYHYSAIGNTTFTTGSKGTAAIYYIPAGIYTLREISATGTGYTQSKDMQVDVTWQNGSSNPATVRFDNSPITLVFTKTDALTKKLLDGGVFQLRDEAGGIVKLQALASGSYKPDDSGSETFTTKDGEAVIRYLPPQTYKIEELAPPAGYKRDETQTVIVDAHNDAGNSAKASMEDEPLALEFSKTDKMTGRAMDGADFVLKDSAGHIVKLTKVSNGIYMPDSKGSNTFTTYEGKAMIGPIDPCTYTITETKPAAGYASAADITITVTTDNVSSNPAKGSMADAPLALRIMKLDGEKKTPIGGAVFCLLDGENVVNVSPIAGKPGWYRPDDGGAGTFTPPEDGVIIAYLSETDYTLVEVSPPKGYAMASENTNITINQTHTCETPLETTVENAPLIVTVAKSDGYSNNPLPGVSFHVMDANGVLLRWIATDEAEYSVDPNGETMFTTGEYGIATLRLIPEGDYTLIEADHPGFGKMDHVPFAITKDNTNENPVAIGVENFPLFFELIKTDKFSGKPLAGVEFKMLCSSNDPLRFTKQEDGSYQVTAEGDEIFATDENGRAIISYIPVGIYTIIEQEYDGYGVLAPAHVTILDNHFRDNPATIQLMNTPLAMELIKIDSATKETLSGVEFKLLKDGEHIRMALMSDGSYRPACAIDEVSAVLSEFDSDAGEAEHTGRNDEAEPKEKPHKPATLVKFCDAMQTNENGRIRIEYLNLGEYTLEEQAHTGYVQLSGLSFHMKSTHTMDEPLVYTISNVPTRFLLEKQHAITKEPLLGAKFSITDQDGKKVSLFQQENGVFRPAKKNEKSVDIFELDKNAQAVIEYLPAGVYTVTEEEAPSGFAAVAPIQTQIGTKTILHTSLEAQGDGFERSNLIAETSLAVEDFPLALKIKKVHARTQKPLQGAAFALKAEGAIHTPLRFSLVAGIYYYDDAGSITTIELDKNAEAMIYNIPAGKYILEEVVVPEHFFPAAPINIEIKMAHTSQTPYEVIVVNTPTVKLGMDSDKFDTLIVIAVTLLIGSVIAFVLVRRRKKLK